MDRTARVCVGENFQILMKIHEIYEFLGDGNGNLSKKNFEKLYSLRAII